MTVNLIAATLNSDGTRASAQDEINAANWKAITAIAPQHGMIFIDDATVTAIAALLSDQPLSNGQEVSAYPVGEYDCVASLVCAFGPSLLPADVQDAVRDLLIAGTNGQQAADLFNEIIRLELQISLSGTEFCDAHIKGVNWIADEVEINRTASNMARMFTVLGLGAYNKRESSSSIPLGEFEAAINDNGHLTDMPMQLRTFADCAIRNRATHIYWA